LNNLNRIRYLGVLYAKISSLVKKVKVKAKAQENEAMPCEILKFYVLQMPASEK